MTAVSPDILFVVGELGIGGTERHLLSVGRQLRRAGWQVCVYSLAGDGALRGELESAGIEVILPPVGRSAIPNLVVIRVLRIILSAVHLTYIMARTRPRLAHFFLPAAYLIGAIAASLARVKIRVMSRRSLNTYQQAFPLVRRLEMKLHGSMNAVLGNSNAVVRQLRDEGVASGKLGLIYNGIEQPSASLDNRTAVRSSLEIDERTLVYVIVANLIPYKGHLDLVAALGIANGRLDQPWRLLVVGRDDGAASDIRALAKRLNLEDKILFMGMRSDVVSLMLASDIGLLCSHQEGFSNAILEAMAVGLPMIVTDVGGNAEAVLDGETGLVVPPHHPEALAEAIVSLARDPLLRKTFGETGRARLKAHFLLDGCVERYQALYRGLLQGQIPRDIPEVHCTNGQTIEPNPSVHARLQT
jgi:glycosyltransferase involved in cell wall biosynthesis